MKPRITFQDGNRIIIAGSRDFSELPPVNQELDLRDQRYKVVGYESATVLVKVVPVVEASEAPQRSKATKRAAKVQAKKAKAAAKGKTAGDGKTAATAVRGNFYNRKGN